MGSSIFLAAFLMAVGMNLADEESKPDLAIVVSHSHLVLGPMMFLVCPFFPSGTVPTGKPPQWTLIGSAGPCSLSSPRFPSCAQLPDLFGKVIAK